MKQAQINIILPPTASTDIDNDLVELTRYLVESGYDDGSGGGYGLGGEYGYGINFENNVFMMHPFCWCGKRECGWCLECYCEAKKIKEKYVTTNECDNHSKERLPNFWYKPTNLKIHWYKWIGRDMEFNKDINDDEWEKILKHCIESINKQ
jgi:hypothetical protein